ncbi:unnamed protein product [Soboliphyme baturini]|uniref:Tudor domain-containing protein n=1 Tax=Soboliphyme baturini TaxID=241478 RepID=A0A183IVD9_9BILA|nr:unnamed protein product [Soboliphyme baturini]
MEKEIQSYYASLDSTIASDEIRKGLLCIAPCKRGFCRAVIELPTISDCLVRFVDYGFTQVCQFADMKPIDPKFYHFPACSVHCRVYGSHVLHFRFDLVSTFLKEIEHIDGKVFCMAVSVTEEFASVELFDQFMGVNLGEKYKTRDAVCPIARPPTVSRDRRPAADRDGCTKAKGLFLGLGVKRLLVIFRSISVTEMLMTNLSEYMAGDYIAPESESSEDPSSEEKYRKRPVRRQKGYRKEQKQETAKKQPLKISASNTVVKKDSYLTEYPSKTLTGTAEVYLTHFDSFEDMYFRHAKDNLLYANEVMPRLRELGNSRPRFIDYRDVDEGIACAVLNGSEWQRATVLEKTPDYVKFQTIDIGECVSISVSDAKEKIMWLPKYGSLALPPMTYHCHYAFTELLITPEVTDCALEILTSTKWVATFQGSDTSLNITQLKDERSGEEFRTVLKTTYLKRLCKSD